MLTAKEKNGKLLIEIDMQKPTASKSGKTLVVATTSGNKETDLVIKGKKVTIGLNAYIKND